MRNPEQRRILEQSFAMDTETCTVAAAANDHIRAVSDLAAAVRRSRRLNCHKCTRGPDCQDLAELQQQCTAAVTLATRTTKQPATKRARNRGAQPGNLNALRHGFYSRGFQAMEIDDLEAETAQGLDDEIKMLRVVTRRVLQLAENMDDLDNAVTVLSALGAAATRTAHLLRTQKLLGADTSDTTAALQTALAAVMTDLCLST